MRLSNDLFARAINWLIDEQKVRDQQELASLTGITETTISRILNDRVKQPSKETVRRLLDAFPGVFNPAFFRGESIWMLMSEVTENREVSNSAPSEPAAPTPDMSSVFNAALAAKDDAIESLKRELLTKDELIQALHEQIATKNQLITEQKARLIDYRRIIDAHNGIERPYPFPVGVADV